MQNISEVLLHQLNKNPEKFIIYLQESGKKDFPITYADLIQKSCVYSKHYKERNLKPGDICILLLQHGQDLLYSYFGAVLYGIVPSIMPFLTEKLLPERYRIELSKLFSITNPHAIVTYKDFSKEIFSAIKSDLYEREIIISEDVYEKEDEEYPIPTCGKNRKPEDIVLLQHSSGTTGLQKGVALSHKAVLQQLYNYKNSIQLCDTDFIVSWLPLYHDMGLIAGFLMPILLGTPLVLMSPFEWVRAPYKLLRAISDYKGTLCWLPNFAYNFCAKKIRENQIEGINLSTLRAVINCSEPMRWKSHQMFYEKFHHYGFRKESLATCYAMAENVFAVTQDGIKKNITIDEIDLEAFQKHDHAKPASENELQTIKMISAGSPIEGTQIKIVDSDGNNVADRKIGEILIKSNYMLSEYYNRPDETRKSFLNEWFKTGDLGYIADEELYISGRKKDLIIVGGKNIYPQDLEILSMEVEGVHPGRTVAFGIDNDETGTEDVVIVAEVDEEYQDQKERIAEEIRIVINKGSAISLKNVYLVSERWLVKTSSGKIARSANKQKYLSEFVNVS